MKTLERWLPASVPPTSLLVLLMVPVMATCSALVCQPPRELSPSELRLLYDFEASAAPTILCEGDPLRVRWEMSATELWGDGRDLCPTLEDCPGSPDYTPLASVEITSSPAGLLAADPVPADELAGERSVTPTASGVVRAAATLTDRRRASTDARDLPFEVLDAGVVDYRQVLVGTGVCLEGSPRRPGWLAPSIDRDTLLGESVDPVSLCNLTPFEQIRLQVQWDSGPDTEGMVARGDCYPFLDVSGLDRRVRRVVPTVVDPTALVGTDCPPPADGTVVGEPPRPDRPPRDYLLEIEVRCRIDP